ncbi:MAG: TetR/AcrR family transcriptional regulator [Reyranella sp.]
MRRRRTQAARSAATRRALVESAVRLLIAHGYAGASVRNIARDSGHSSGAVQYHFKCKEDVVIAALTHLFAEMAQRLAGPGPRDTAIDRRARHIVETLWAFYGGTSYIAVLEVLVATRPQAALHRRIRSACRRGLAAACRDIDERLLGEGPRTPAARQDLLQFVIATLCGLALLRLQERDRQRVEPHLARLRDLVAAALRPHGSPSTAQAAARRPDLSSGGWYR